MDLIVSADTLCYFDDLTEVLQSAFACLKKNGLPILTVEAGPTNATQTEARHTEATDATTPNVRYQQRQNGRYRHSVAYVTQTLGEVDFGVGSVSPAVLRNERGLPADLDGVVDAADLNAVALNWQSTNVGWAKVILRRMGTLRSRT